MRAFLSSHATTLKPRSPVRRGGLALLASAALAGAALPAAGLLAGTAAAIVNPDCTASSTFVTCVFSYNGSTTINGTAIPWTVPAGITTLDVTADGAHGGSSGATLNPGSGGAGGEASAQLTNIPGGTILSVFPGGSGLQGTGGGAGIGGGGGNAGAGLLSAGGSGGGASSVSISGGSLFGNLLVVGGGGGGGSSTVSGGNGGTSRHPAGDGGESAGLATGGGGGTLMGGGAAGGSLCLTPALPGIPLKGGNGGGGIICPSGGGGGGGGYYGGGGGGGSAGAGGGGSAFPGSTTTVGGITVTPSRDNALWSAGNGQVIIRYRLISTSTAVNCLPNPSTPGQSVTCTATITPGSAAGTVNFEAGGSTIGDCGAQPVTSGTATCTTTTLPDGDNTITAIFSPTLTLVYRSSTGTTTQVVNAVTTQLRSSLVVHANGTYTLIGVLAAGGSGLSGQTITFSAGRSGPVLCTAVTGGSGVASCLLSRAETRTLLEYNGAFTASFAGAGEYDASSAYYRGIIWF